MGPLRRKRNVAAALLFSVTLITTATVMAATEDLKEHLRSLVFFGAPRPDPTGRFGVGSVTVELSAGPGGTAMPVSLYYPSAGDGVGTTVRIAAMINAFVHPTRARTWPGAPLARSPAAHPLLLYFPSWFSRRHENSFTLANLASHGFIIASIDDIAHLAPQLGPDRDVQMAGIDDGSEDDFAASRSIAAERTRLEAGVGSAVLDRLMASENWGKGIDSRRIGAIGFSFGGGVAAEISRSDPRVRAVVNLDGSLFGDTQHRGIDSPFLTFFADNPFPTAQARAQPDLAARFEAILDHEAVEQQLRQDAQRDSWTFVVDGSAHLDFSDRLLMPAFSDGRRARDPDRIRMWSDVNAYLVAFFNAYLRGISTQLLSGEPPFIGIKSLESARARALSDDPDRR